MGAGEGGCRFGWLVPYQLHPCGAGASSREIGPDTSRKRRATGFWGRDWARIRPKGRKRGQNPLTEVSPRLDRGPIMLLVLCFGTFMFHVLAVRNYAIVITHYMAGNWEACLSWHGECNGEGWFQRCGLEWRKVRTDDRTGWRSEKDLFHWVLRFAREP